MAGSVHDQPYGTPSVCVSRSEERVTWIWGRLTLFGAPGYATAALVQSWRKLHPIGTQHWRNFEPSRKEKKACSPGT